MHSEYLPELAFTAVIWPGDRPFLKKVFFRQGNRRVSFVITVSLLFWQPVKFYWYLLKGTLFIYFFFSGSSQLVFFFPGKLS